MLQVTLTKLKRITATGSGEICTIRLHLDGQAPHTYSREMKDNQEWDLGEQQHYRSAFYIEFFNGEDLGPGDLLGTIHHGLETGEHTRAFYVQGQVHYELIYTVEFVDVDEDVLYEAIDEWEQQFQEEYARKSVSVGRFHADTGEFEHDLGRADELVTDPGYTNVLNPNELQEAVQLYNPELLYDPAIQFELPIAGLEDEQWVSLRAHHRDRTDPERVRLKASYTMLWPIATQTQYPYALIKVNAVGVELVFKVTGHQRPVQLRLYNIKVRNSMGELVSLPEERVATAGVGEQEVTAWAGAAERVSWQIVCGDKHYNDTIRIERPGRQSCFGVFKTEALPLAIVYSPPDPMKATYKRETWHRLLTQTGITYEESSTGSVPTKLDDYHSFRSGVSAAKGVSGALSSVHPYIAALHICLQVLDGVLDFIGVEGEGSSVEGSQVTKNGALVLEDRESIEQLAPPGGPGVGDQFVLLTGVRFAWVGSKPCSASLLYLGADGILLVTAQELLEDLNVTQPECGLSHTTIASLLALDPFINASHPLELDPLRFTKEKTVAHSPDSAETTIRASHTILEADQYATVAFRTEVKKEKYGLLAMLNLMENSSTLMKHTISASTEEAEGEMVSTAIICPPHTEYYTVRVWYDNVFGTFATALEETRDHNVISGTIVDRLGRAVSQQLVELVAGDREYITYTDANGRFAFRASSIKPGRMTLKAGTLSKTVQLLSTPLTNVRLRLG